MYLHVLVCTHTYTQKVEKTKDTSVKRCDIQRFWIPPQLAESRGSLTQAVVVPKPASHSSPSQSWNMNPWHLILTVLVTGTLATASPTININNHITKYCTTGLSVFLYLKLSTMPLILPAPIFLFQQAAIRTEARGTVYLQWHHHGTGWYSLWHSSSTQVCTDCCCKSKSYCFLTITQFRCVDMSVYRSDEVFEIVISKSTVKMVLNFKKKCIPCLVLFSH